MPDFPDGIPDIPPASASETLFSMHGGLAHAGGTNRILTNLIGLATKLGWGVSSPGSVPGVLRRSASAQSEWGPVRAQEMTGPGVGSPNTVLRTTEGTGTNVAYGKVAAADIPAQIITGGSSGSGMHIGYHQVTGEQAGGNSNIAPQTIPGSYAGAGTGNILAGTLHNRDLVAQTIRGGVDGGGSRIAPASIRGSSDIELGSLIDSLFGAGAIHGNKIANDTLTAAQIGPGAIGTSELGANAVHYLGAVGPWTQAMGVTAGFNIMHGSAQINNSAFAGGYVVAILWGWGYGTAALGNPIYMGIGMDTTATPGVQTYSAGNPSCGVPYCLVYPYGGLSGSHTFYGIGRATGADATFNGMLLVIEFKR